MARTMKEIREELKTCYDIQIIFVGKKGGVSVYRIFSKTFPINNTEYTKSEIIKKWLLY